MREKKLITIQANHFEIFNIWLEKILVPELPQNSVVVMDNATFYKSHKTKEILSTFLICSSQSIFAQGSGTVEFVRPDIRVQESVGEISIPVSRNKSNLLPSSVNYIVTRSSATIDVDYSMTHRGC